MNSTARPFRDPRQSMPDCDAALRAATEAAAKARTRVLAVRLEQLRTQARPEPVRPTPWSGCR
ncbi:hypothetical protein ACWD0A_34380 [Streptomyces sp. NPDC002867]